MGRSPIGQIVPVHAGHHGEGQAQGRHGLCHPLGFLRVDLAGLAFADIAETAVPCADLTQEHESGRAVEPPALVLVGAAGLLAHRHQFLRAHEPLHLGRDLGGRNLDLQPGGTRAGKDGRLSHGNTLPNKYEIRQSV